MAKKRKKCVDTEPAAADETHILTDDALIYVFSRLPLDSRISCMAVCKRWRACLSHPSLYEQVDLSPWYRKVTDEVLSNIVTKSDRRMRELSLGRCDKITNIDSLVNLTQLEKLDLLDCSALDTNAFDILLKLPSTLTYLDLCGCWKQEHNKIGMDFAKLASFTNLRHLAIEAQLAQAWSTTAKSIVPLMALKDLRHLELKDVIDGEGEGSPGPISSLLTALTNLDTLIYRSYWKYGPTDFAQLSRITTLRVLELTILDMSFIRDLGFLETLTRLETLRLVKVLLSETAAQPMARLSNLTYLHLELEDRPADNIQRLLAATLGHLTRLEKLTMKRIGSAFMSSLPPFPNLPQCHFGPTSARDQRTG